MGLIGGVIQTLYCGGASTLFSPVSFLQRPLRWLRGDQPHRRDHQRRAQLRLRPLRREDDARAACGAGPEPLAGRVQRRRAGPRRDARAVRRGVRPGRLPARGVPALLRPGRGHAARLRRSAGPAPVVLSVDAECARPGRGRRGGRRRLRRTRLVSSGRAAEATSSRSSIPPPARPCPEDRVGEIWVSGPSVAPGYWDRPEESRRRHGRPPGRARRPLVPPHRATSASCATASCSSPAGSRT